MEERAKDIASSFVTHVHKMAGIRADEESEEGIRNLTVYFSPWVFSFFFVKTQRNRGRHSQSDRAYPQFSLSNLQFSLSSLLVA